MPTYEYRCARGHTFDAFQKMSDPPLATCPDCGAEAQRMLSGGAGFLFKGEGFYITDYRSADYKKKAESEKSASGSPDATPEKASKTSKPESAGKKESASKPSEGSSGAKGSKGSKGSSGATGSGTDG